MKWRGEINEWHAIGLSLLLMATAIVLLVLSGCKVVEREVPVVVEHTHHTASVDVQRDTLLQRDSIYHFVQGDTLRVERWHYTTRVEVVERRDTVRDTIPQVVTVTEVRTKADGRVWWWAAGATLLALALLVAVAKK
jgi:hypothetical protein